jgi:hypothetical protein
MRQVLVLAGLALFSACTYPDISCRVAGRDETGYAVYEVHLPRNASAFAVDLDGDGRRTNRLGGVVDILRQVGVDPAEYVDGALAAGSFAPALHTVVDGVWRPDARDVGARFGQADRPGSFCGEVSADRFTSDPGWPAIVEMDWPFLAGQRLRLSRARISFRKIGETVEGQLNGALAEDQYPALHRAIATLMSEKLSGDPNAPLSMQLRSLFDTGCVEGRGDGVINECEVRASPIVQALLAPDERLCAGPLCATDDPLGLSFGVGFRGRVGP